MKKENEPPALRTSFTKHTRTICFPFPSFFPNVVNPDTQNFRACLRTLCPFRTFQSPGFSKPLNFWKQENAELINIPAATLQGVHKLFVVFLRLHLSADCYAEWQKGWAGANLWVWGEAMYIYIYIYRWSLLGLWIFGYKRDAGCLISSGHHCYISKANFVAFLDC